jgi:asparaginyl-tRNA synthetase
MDSVVDIFANAQDGDVVRINGWVQRKTKMKDQTFLKLRDGSGIIQVSVKRDDTTRELLAKITTETSVMIRGSVVVDKRAPGGKEIHASTVDIIGDSIPLQLNKDAGTHTLFENRHIVIRESRLSNVIRLRSYMDEIMREYFRANDFIGVTPPTIIGQEVEGGSTLFGLKYHGEDAFMTQSSQLYLESVVPVFKNVYCIMPSYRQENSNTRRHLSEYTHVEAELGFISFSQLLDCIEGLIKYTVNTLLSRHESIVKALNDKYESLRCDEPFERVPYSEFIERLNKGGYLNPETGKPYVYGEDVTESVERKFIDAHGKGMFVTRFATNMKAFYMQPCADNPDETESADLLLPNVGEVVGGSMRIWDKDALLKKIDEFGLDKDSYKWYIDQRIYGSVPHGGFGLGFERLLMWIANQDHIKDCCLYPRAKGQLVP